MNKEIIIKQVQTAIGMAQKALKNGESKHYQTGDKIVSPEQFSEWRSFSLSILKRFSVVNEEYYTEFEKNTESTFNRDYSMERGLGTLKAIEKELLVYPVDLIEKKDKRNELENLFNRFHNIVRQIRRRHDSRETLDVKDEYDVQDLLHSILPLFFEDIRSEEWTPSYAGSSSRMDFLLKEIDTVIEVKMTRRNLKDKEIGKQLIDDIAHYKQHPNCKSLICFVYDPDGYIQNAVGIEEDLNKLGSDKMEVTVYVKPK